MDDTRHLSELRLLNAALAVIRAKGYSATRIEDVCAEAGLTKGSFFHHFNGKEDLAVAAADYWSETTSAFFADAPYHQIADPLDRLLGYIDYRKELLGGRPAEFSCLVGTMVQETFDTAPPVSAAFAAMPRSCAPTSTKPGASTRQMRTGRPEVWPCTPRP